MSQKDLERAMKEFFSRREAGLAESIEPEDPSIKKMTQLRHLKKIRILSTNPGTDEEGNLKPQLDPHDDNVQAKSATMGANSPGSSEEKAARAAKLQQEITDLEQQLSAKMDKTGRN